jgi:hypothetical protein
VGCAQNKQPRRVETAQNLQISANIGKHEIIFIPDSASILDKPVWVPQKP